MANAIIVGENAVWIKASLVVLIWDLKAATDGNVPSLDGKGFQRIWSIKTGFTS